MAASTKELVPGEAELLDRARRLGPKLRQRRLAAAEARRMPAETIADLIDSGLLRASLPARFGGYELPFGAHTTIATELGRHCGATAWVAAILSSHNWWLGKYHPAAQEEIWADGPDALVAAAFACKNGQTVPDHGGGYRITGEWMYCSGIDNCDWAILVGPLVNDQGTDHCMTLLHRSQYRIKDVWQAPGLAGTGSNNVVVEDAQVAAHRVVRVAEMNQRLAPGASMNPGPTYRLPTMGVFAYSVATPVIGMAQGCLDAFVDGMRQRHEVMSSNKIADTVTMRLRVSESSADIDAARSLYRDHISDLRLAAEQSRDLTPRDLTRVQRNCAYIARLCKQATSRLVEAMGAGGLDRSNPVQVAHMDVLAGAAHKALSWDFNMPNYGEQLFQGQADKTPAVPNRTGVEG